MSATDGQVIVAAARWSEESQHLQDYVSKNKFPSVVKIIKGQYGGIGVPTLPNPSLQSIALLVSVGKRKKIIAQAVKFKEGRRLVSVGPRIAIPETYKGFFELLSEEGKAIRCMESVSEIARRRLEDGCLVREPLRGLVARIEADGSIFAHEARNIPAGEVIMIKGEVQLGNSKNNFLKCVDSKGEMFLLNLEQRGKFSAIAKVDNISGVHTAKNLLSKRMPMSVRLVYGTPPRGLKTASHFIPEIRLLSTTEEEHIFALPLQKEGNFLTALPKAAPIKVQRCNNDDHIKNFMEFSRLVEKCNRLLCEVVDRIHVLDGKLGDSTRFLGSNMQTPPVIKSGHFLRRSASSDTANRSNKYSHTNISQRSYNIVKNENKTLPPDEYDEIDQIYDYVRGFAPLPKNIKSNFSSDPAQVLKYESATTSPTTTPVHMPLLSILDKKPEPPPIETIPTKNKIINIQMTSPKAEKRTRKAAISMPKENKPLMLFKPNSSTPPVIDNLPKLYIKNSNKKNKIIFRQKSNSPIRDQTSSPLTSPMRPLSSSKEVSPLFNIRYKSLSNLQQGMELDGTLDSSHSGGRTSGDSGAGVKLPEKRSRRLSRPKSLTNLVWELRGYPIDQKNEKNKLKNKNEPNYKKNSNKLSLSVANKRGPILYL